jgi:hypothetical protein
MRSVHAGPLAAALTALAGLLACGSGSGTRAPPAVDASGTWLGELHTTTGESALILLGVTQQPGGTLAGELELQMLPDSGANSYTVDGWVSGNQLSLRHDFGSSVLQIGGSMDAGAATASGDFSSSLGRGSWTAHRLPAVHLASQALFTIPGDVSAMVVVGDRLWVAGLYVAGDGTYGLCTYSLAGAKDRCFAFPQDTPNELCAGSMAFDGTQVWCVARNYYAKLWRLGTDGALAGSVSFPQGFCHLTHDGANLRCARPLHLDTLDASGATLSSADLSLPFPTSAVWDGSAFWMADPNPPRIYRVGTNGALLGAAEMPAMQVTATGREQLWAIAHDGSRLLAAVQRADYGTSPPTLTTTIHALVPQ